MRSDEQEGDHSDVEKAVAAAKRAQIEWAKIPAQARGKLIMECGRILETHAEELAVIALESGKGAQNRECRWKTSIPG